MVQSSFEESPTAIELENESLPDDRKKLRCILLLTIKLCLGMFFSCIMIVDLVLYFYDCFGQILLNFYNEYSNEILVVAKQG